MGSLSRGSAALHPGLRPVAAPRLRPGSARAGRMEIPFRRLKRYPSIPRPPSTPPGPLRAGWDLRVSVIAADPASEFEEHGGRMLVGGDGVAESEEAEVLEGVVEFVEAGVAGVPVFVALGEEVGGEGAEAEEVIAAVHDITISLAGSLPMRTFITRPKRSERS